MGGCVHVTTLDRRRFLKTGLALGAGMLGAPAILRHRFAFADESVEISTRAIDLVTGRLVIDMLGLLTMDWPKLFGWQREAGSFSERDFRELESTGVNVFHPAVETNHPDAYTAARRWLRGWDRLLTGEPCFLRRIETFSDLVRAPRQGKIGVLLGLQNSNHFRTPEDVERFFRLGQRVSQLTYNGYNRLGGGNAVRDRGLTDFGAEVVAEMNRLGMIVDVSHCGPRTTLDALRSSRKPVLVTHSNCKALAPHSPRNKSDREIRLLAAAGGVMGITLVRGFVGRGSPTLEDVLDHFDHVARLVGIEHVGLGTDVAQDALDPETGRPLPYYSIRGVDLSKRVFQLTEGLIRRGYTDRHIELVLGGNFVRALGEIWSEQSWKPLADDARSGKRDPFCPAPRYPLGDSP